MSRRLSTLVGLAVVAASLGAWTTAASAASPVGPQQVFVGLVNGKVGDAEIRVGCFGPIYAGETGHVLPGQSVEALPAPSTGSTAGYTGTKATKIKLSIVLPVSPGVGPGSGVVLANYGVPVALPTSWSLPCSGPGAAVFLPEPTSKTARSATVGVSFVSAGVTSHIVARPTHVMVNQNVRLTGTGFAPATSLTLVECSLTHSIVPQNPCLSRQLRDRHDQHFGVVHHVHASRDLPGRVPSNGHGAHLLHRGSTAHGHRHRAVGRCSAHRS